MTTNSPTRSVKRGVLVPLLIVFCALELILVFSARYYAEKQMNDSLLSRGRSAADSIDYAIQTVQNVGSLNRFVSAMGGEPDMGLIVVTVGEPPLIVASTRHELKGIFFDEIPGEYLANEMSASHNREVEGMQFRAVGDYYAFSQNVSLTRLFGEPNTGTVSVFLERRRFVDELWLNFWRRLGISAVGMVFIFVFATWLLDKQVLSPISKISKSVRWRNEDKDVSVFPELPNDELGVLSRCLEDAFDSVEAKSEEAREYAEALRFQKQALDTHAIVSETDPSGRITYVNENFVQVSGYSREELLGQDHRIINSGYHSKSFWKNMYETLKTEGVWKGLVRNRNKAGEFYWVDSTNFAFKDESGKIVRYVSIRANATQRIEAENRLRESEQRLQLALESANVGLWDLNIPDGKVLVNDVWKRLIDYEEDELDVDFETWKSLVHQDDLQRALDSVDEHLKGETESYHAEFRMCSKLGEWVWIASAGRVVEWNEEGEATRMIGVHLDVTERVGTFRKLEKAIVAAESASRAKSQFLATMSHEIRTPMNGLIGVLHLLEDGLPNDKVKLLNTAQNSAEDLLVLINDILDFSKIEAGKMELESIEFDAKELIEDVCELHAASAYEKGLEVAAIADPGVNYVSWGDPHRVRQVLSNLFGNAVKFTESGEIIVGLKLLRSDIGDCSLRFQVSDTGIGIKEEALGKLFDSFTQANTSTTRQFGGTGLGLAICKKLIEMMDGELGVDSSEGQGSTFWFELPLVSCPLPLKDQEGQHPLKGKRGVLADSNDTTRAFIGKWLEYWGCEIESFGKMKDVVDGIQNLDQDFDYFIIDEQRISSHLDSWRRIIEENPHFENAKVVLLHKYSELPDKAVEKLGYSRVRKPIRTDSLKEALVDGGEVEVVEKKDNNRARYEDARVLLVDDNLTNRMIAQQLLSVRHGIKAETANDGVDALGKLETLEYDLVLMDCMMPEMDGYDATRALRAGKAGKANQNIPVIALTANAMTGDREECLAAGMSDYLSKPLRPEAVAEVFSKWLHKDGGADEKLDSPNGDQVSDVLDLSRLINAYEGNMPFVREMLGIFKEGMEETLAELEEAVKSNGESRKIDDLRMFSHRLRGSSAEFGANELSNICKNMEENCRDDKLEEAIKLFPDVKEAASKVLDKIGNMDL